MVLDCFEELFRVGDVTNVNIWTLFFLFVMVGGFGRRGEVVFLHSFEVIRRNVAKFSLLAGRRVLLLVILFGGSDVVLLIAALEVVGISMSHLEWSTLLTFFLLVDVITGSGEVLLAGGLVVRRINMSEFGGGRRS